MDDHGLVSLGMWIKRRRKALDLTQDALAGLVGCSKNLIVKIEGDARRPSKQIASLLAEHLQLAPDERETFVRAARAEFVADQLPPPLASVPRRPFAPNQLLAMAPPGNIPAELSSFLGRSREIVELLNLLGNPGTRLVTLTGPGGTGKTRLALRVAAALTSVYPDGVWVVDLAPLTGPELLTAAVLQALAVTDHPNIPPISRLLGWLRPKRLLLVLDNFEHIVEAAPLVTDILRAALHVHIIATSRVPLHLTGEQEYPVAPLPVPDVRMHEPVDVLSQNVAVQLFADRAGAVRPDFALTSETAQAVAESCVRLEGLPLAIELAAARVRAYPPQVLLARLQEALLPTLVGGPRDAPPRQQTIRATIAWSVATLPPVPQRLLARLSVFVGSWTLEAALVVGQEDGLDVAEGLQALVEHSLVQHIGERYTMLATIREYAWYELAGPSDREVTQQRHAEYVAAFSMVTRDRFERGDPRAAPDVLDCEHLNVHAALDWTSAHAGDNPLAAELGTQIAAGLWYYWQARRHSDLVHWLHMVLAPDWPATSGCARAQVLNAAWFVEHDPNTWSWSQELTEQGLALSRELRDPVLIAEALNHLGEIANGRGDYAQAEAYFADSLEHARRANHAYRIGWALFGLGKAMLRQGKVEQAPTHLDQARATFESFAHLPGLLCTARVDGELWDHRGDARQAAASYLEMQRLARTLGDEWALIWTHLLVGQMLLQCGEYAEALVEFEEANYRVAISRDPEVVSDLSATVHDWLERARCMCGSTDRTALEHQAMR